MRHAVLALTAAALLSGAAAPALAQAPPADVNDTRCLMVLQVIGRDPNQRDQAARGVFFYVGRLGARGPLSRIEPIMVAESKKMGTPQLLQAELTRCSAELNQRGGELQAINQKLAKDLGPPPAAAPAPKAAAAPAKK